MQHTIKIKKNYQTGIASAATVGVGEATVYRTLAEARPPVEQVLNRCLIGV